MEVERLGILGGTFNPIHLGHLVVAEEVRERFSLDRMLFIPAYIPPHKSVDVAPAKARLAIVRMAIENNLHFGLSDIEIRRGTKSYTVDTLKELKDSVRASIYFLLGSEAFLQIHTWRNPPELFRYAHFVIMERAGRKVTFEELEDYLKEFYTRFPQVEFYYQGKVGDLHVFMAQGEGFESSLYLTPVVNIGISSTGIRRRIREGRSIKYRVPSKVEEFIYGVGLYR